MAQVLLGLGGNIGNRYQNIQNAYAAIHHQCGNVLRTSSIYETKAWGKTDQPSFLNACCVVKTPLSPILLLNTLKQIEKGIGRTPTERWGPREIDIDILLYGSVHQNKGNLNIPHASMHERNFVLVPACEVAAGWKHPVFQKSLRELLLQSPDQTACELWRG